MDGDSLLALVNRSPRFALSPSFAPDDLVDVETGLPARADECYPPDRQCLRRPAAVALRALLGAMAGAGHPGHVHSAFRSFGAQCEVFRAWAYRRGRGFCAATTQSALPGHSQHQLGTALDLFTRAWAEGGPVLRNGFGCSPGGRWLAENAWRFGYVLPYPMPVDARAPGSSCRAREGTRGGVDPRTGYSYEPWHLRYVGEDAAARFHAAWAAAAGTGAEPTLEQWLRREHGITGDADLPVCDGCSCGLCATFRGDAPAPCGDRALVLDDAGEPVPEQAPPRLVAARVVRATRGLRVEVEVAVARHTVTQTPVAPRYEGAASWSSLALAPDGPAHAFPDLRGAWRLAAGPLEGDAFPWRAALRDDDATATMNGANLLLPTVEGTHRLSLEVPARGRGVRVALVREGAAREARVLTVEP